MSNQSDKNLLKRKRILLENLLHICVNFVIANSAILALKTFILREDVIDFNTRQFFL